MAALNPFDVPLVLAMKKLAIVARRSSLVGDSSSNEYHDLPLSQPTWPWKLRIRSSKPTISISLRTVLWAGQRGARRPRRPCCENPSEPFDTLDGKKTTGAPTGVHRGLVFVLWYRKSPSFSASN